MKKIEKKLLVIGWAVGMILSMSACASVSGIQEHADQVAEEKENLVTEPEEYSITYEVQEPEDGTITLVTKTCDAEGNIYYSNGERELLFLNEQGRYKLYERSGEDDFTESAVGKLYTSDYIEGETGEFNECAEQTEKQSAPGFSETDETSIAGRTCRVFENTMGVAGMNVTYVLTVDKETGVCMGWDEVSETGSFDAETSEELFSCTEFITEDVTLPIDISSLH